MNLVTAMAGNPCADTIAPLHVLMNGLQGCSLIHHEVPSEVMLSLQVEFTETLRNLDDHMGNLMCLATFARIASTRKTNSHPKHGPEPPSWLVSIQHFFGPKRGLKTLDLVVLRVILACSSNCNNLTTSQAADSIRLAICIANAIKPEQKQAWLSFNASKISKLCEKVSRDGLDREIQMMVRLSIHSDLWVTDFEICFRASPFYLIFVPHQIYLVTLASSGCMSLFPRVAEGSWKSCRTS